jgi:hypothetical protein
VKRPSSIQSDNQARYEDLIRRMLDVANVRRKQMEGMSPGAALKYIYKVITDNDIVLRVWPEGNDVRALVIKGKPELFAWIRSGQPIPRRISAIPCIEPDQAIADIEKLDTGL